MDRYFDEKNKRLICIGEAANPRFWDTVWSNEPLERTALLSYKKTLVTKITKRYLDPNDGSILEGGCGLSKTVASLQNNKYRVIGVDSAAQTVEKINRCAPELDIRLGDIRKLAFENNYFAGYWSLGVIEHFWNGFDDIASEMYRVLKPGGYLFVSFPYMSPLRTLKAAVGCYQRFDPTMDISNFQEFILDPRTVTRTFEQKKFTLVSTTGINQIKGLFDEWPRVKPALLGLQKWATRSRSAQIILRLLSIGLSPVTSHSRLLIFKKIS